MKSFIYDNLPYVLLSAIALALLFTDREIGFGLNRNIREDSGIVIGLAEQRVLALLVLLFTAWKILMRPRR
ncbi:hypothetical protein [Pseudomonas sp. Gutcm_11s]|uniref:hypothetical protein n=1 Tax=Pseudomonas sp. Gutcm_11s TaxID=3026088 RepID=UPI00235ECC8F|nr:hypothetical protein [Pseudomonas sp. Gutcm_11s]MDD0842246.1 hypothetical protein [Pseudomonas sp. Gutcm_11s]